uniref:DUF1700 domain-containing protein n=1 Tax=Candidatus Methanophagaceae archaeon ANME-1 ERB6 TaxID=2759912 RepID=A0A7G9YUP8_9EURY|nr:hypothetical protein LBHPMFOL_00001 [Methanosarcinales archaeon ANME-1 ERB6]
MNKKEFMEKLDNALTGIPKDEKKEVMRDYEDHFSIGLEKGRTEEEIAKSLGDPASIAKSITAEYSITRAKREPSIQNIFRAIITVTGLGLFNLIFVLIPFIIAVALLFAAYVVAAAFIAVPFLMLVYPASVTLPSGDTPIWMVGIGFHIIGDILQVVLLYVTKGFYKLILAYLQMNIKVIRGE